MTSAQRALNHRQLRACALGFALMKVLLIAFLGMLPLMAEEKPVAEQKPE
ncbi:hypothetical protein Rhal01_03746 [Rubritalea halochordaticola]|uniref:Uncharacterized protein n=1 Tax=Rubritalea halochordaticola TaxID=714537 RepID=A0ABP9V4K1_9BACT